MKQQLLTTGDGSHTLFVPELNEHYHSTSGAFQESIHVYINEGFNFVQKHFIRILEIGFGTGLNALLTLNESIRQNKKVYYESIEAYPLAEDLWRSLNYNSILADNGEGYFPVLHTADWGIETPVTNLFTLKKINTLLDKYVSGQKFDLVYFDAFAPDVQPEMWTQAIFEKMAELMDENGILVTYSAKGTVKQNLRNAGFAIRRLKGAGGKRHMLRAIKFNENLT
ncbi:MAG: tRNA (5-methylaminomethyl-2-thiouridine)(34)-methyltransferase MnmD [Prevotellaceae bacterium]|jgi:tRNA U34 5-methylaminomethyl-2-thiouridine-forming methyltransferase MnmC|nr:tRNA (5-methylaminomethyl-2-thiouridine)(34)-methyltransferase MnmD [Prevotellaceae bacterium]